MADVFDPGMDSDSNDSANPEESQFIVERVVGHRSVRDLKRTNHSWIQGNDDDYRFRTRWVGYAAAEDTWEPPENMKSDDGKYNEQYMLYCKVHNLYRRTGRPKPGPTKESSSRPLDRSLNIHVSSHGKSHKSGEKKKKDKRLSAPVPSVSSSTEQPRPSAVPTPPPKVRLDCPNVVDAMFEISTQKEKRARKVVDQPKKLKEPTKEIGLDLENKDTNLIVENTNIQDVNMLDEAEGDSQSRDSGSPGFEIAESDNRIEASGSPGFDVPDEGETVVEASTSHTGLVQVEKSNLDIKPIKKRIMQYVEEERMQQHQLKQEAMEVDERPISTDSAGSDSSNSESTDSTDTDKVADSAIKTLQSLQEQIDAAMQKEEFEPYFLPGPNMGRLGLTLIAQDQANSFELCKEIALDDKDTRVDRLKNALFSGDIELTKGLFSEWCDLRKIVDLEGKNPNLIARNCIKELCQSCENPEGEDATVLMALSWDRERLPCRNDTGHPWCSAMHFLIENGVDVNEKTNLDWNALMVSVKKGAKCQIKELLKNLADTGIVAKDGRTALHLAVERGDLQLVKWLVWSGCDMNSVGSPSYYPALSPVDLASYDTFRNADMAQWLKNRRSAVDGKMEKWVRHFPNVVPERALCSVRCVPVFDTGSDASIRKLRFHLDNVPSTIGASHKVKPLLFMVPVLYLEHEDQPADSPLLHPLTSLDSKRLAPTVTQVKLNTISQSVFHVPSSGEASVISLSGFEPLIQGPNEMEIAFQRPRITTKSPNVRCCVLLMQPWLCHLK